MKITSIITLSIVLLGLSVQGCSKEKIVYVDSNGSVIKQKPEFRPLRAEVVCDANGYAYYKSVNGSLSPILHNGLYGAYIQKCSSLQ